MLLLSSKCSLLSCPYLISGQSGRSTNAPDLAASPHLPKASKRTVTYGSSLLPYAIGFVTDARSRLVIPSNQVLFGLVFQLGAANKEIQKITEFMSQIHIKGQKVDINREMDLANLLPGTLRGLFSKRIQNAILLLTKSSQLTIKAEGLPLASRDFCFGV